jgi:hypothetical protein
MATYPDLMTAYQSDPEPINSISIDRAEDGTARGRAYGDDKVKIKVVHPRLTSANKSTLVTFYGTNRLLEFTFASKTDGVSYTCIFSKAPRYERHPGSYWTATVEMEQV